MSVMYMFLSGREGRWRQWENRLEHTEGAYNIILLLSIFLFFSGLGRAPIYILDEAKNAQCAREMLAHHNWVVPTFNGELRTDKPVFHYWMMMLAYQLFGVSAFSARFFSAVAGVLLIGYTYRFTRILYDKRTAFWSSIFLLASLHLSLEMHFSVPDPYFIFFVAATVFEYYLFYKSQRRYHLLLSYVWMALGVLSKGPAAILLPGGIVFFHLLLSKSFTWQRIRQLQLISGLGIVLLLAAPWYVMVHQQTEGLWTKGFFLDHNLNRFTTIKEGHGGFFLLTILFVIAGLLPFAVWLVPAIVKMVKNKAYEADDLFLLIAAGFITLFFTISRTKLPNYTIPAYPFFMILLARYWLQHQTTGKEKIQWVIYLVLMLLLPVGIYIAIDIEPAIQPLADMAFLFLLLPAGTWIGWKLWQKGWIWMSRMAVALSFWITTLLLNIIAYPAIYKRNPVQKALAETGGMQHCVAFRSYNPGFNFYLPAGVPIIQDSATLRTYLQQHPGTYVLTREDELPDMGQQPLVIASKEKDIFETPVTVVLAPRLAGASLTK